MKNNSFPSLFEKYDSFKEHEINSSYVLHSAVQKKIEELRSNNIFTIEKLGTSVNNNRINAITFGKGKIKILAWSQMHGDEPTATAALFDLLKFFSSDDEFNPFREELLKAITFHFIPMLNPDGALLFQRENAFNIDINRDALRLQSDESAILWNYALKHKPEFAFNLHDQNSYYTAGRSGKTSAISLLAPPMDYSKSINYTREKSMQVILQIAQALLQFIPGHVARYADDFEPRAFGDNFTKLGISTILIESGFYKGDTQKELIRKMNFVALISSFASIAGGTFNKQNYNEYFKIPENEQLLFDLMIKNVTLIYRERKFKIDIGINRKKKWDSASNKFYFESSIADLGDLSIYKGIEELDLDGCLIKTDSKLAVDSPADFSILDKNNVEIRIKNGFIES